MSSGTFTRQPRARDLGVPFDGETGPLNGITDVPGVQVGYRTLLLEDPIVRTGVTVILPRGLQRPLMPVWSGMHSFNGNGEMTGSHWINETGRFDGPVCITNTHSVGAVHHGATQWMVRHYTEKLGQFSWFLPVVAETWDGYLNDIDGLHVKPSHVEEAIAAAHGGAPAEGNVGGGTGMRCYGFKGGSGTSSRRLGAGKDTWTIGAFVQANFGRREDLMIRGVPVGCLYPWDDERADPVPGHGSIIAVLATDAPLLPTQLARMARRAIVGVARTGSPGQHESGDIFLAFSTAQQPAPASDRSVHMMRYLDDGLMTDVFACAADAVEEAIINALVAAETLSGIAGRASKAIDHRELQDIMSRFQLAAMLPRGK